MHEGGIVAGLVSDVTACRSLTCIVMMALAVPMVRQVF